MRIYQEHLDEEIWKIVATNRDELVKLISCLKGNELVLPSLVGVVDEDSSSNSMPPKVDALQNGNGKQNGNGEAKASTMPASKENVPNLKIRLGTDGESTVEQVKATVDKEDDEGDDDSNVSEIDESSQAASESSATTVGTKSTVNIENFRCSLSHSNFLFSSSIGNTKLKTIFIVGFKASVK